MILEDSDLLADAACDDTVRVDPGSLVEAFNRLADGRV